MLVIIRVGRTARAGRGGVSVSLADEKERLLVKRIIKQTENPVKRRLIPTNIIEKYNKKLQSLEPYVERILQEEKKKKESAKEGKNEKELQNEVDQELVKTESELKHLEKLLGIKDGTKQRKFQSKKEKKTEKGNISILY